MYYVVESNNPMMQFPMVGPQPFQQHYHQIQLQPQPQYPMLQPVQFHPQPLPQQQPSNVYYVMNNGNMVPLVQQPQQHHQPQLFNVVTPPAPTSTPPMVMIMQPQQYSSPPTPLMTNNNNNNMFPQPAKSIVTVRRESSDSESPDLTPTNRSLSSIPANDVLPIPTTTTTTTKASTSQQHKGHTLTCYACRGVGHKATQCPVYPRNASVTQKPATVIPAIIPSGPIVAAAQQDQQQQTSSKDETLIACGIHGKSRTSKNMFFNNQTGVWQCSAHTECKNL
eukprot:PhF_6_TR11698/c3_g3_i5/m.19014